MGAFLGPGRGWEHPDICVRPQPPLLLGLDSNLRVGGQGRENPLVLSPSPSRPGSSASQRPSRPGHTHPRTHTPTGLTIAHTYIHTAAANKGSGHPVPFRHTPSGEGGAFPPQVPYEVSLCLRAAVGRRTRCPGGRGPGRRGSPAPQNAIPRDALRGLQACLPARGCVQRTPDAGDSVVDAAGEGCLSLASETGAVRPQLNGIRGAPALRIGDRALEALPTALSLFKSPVSTASPTLELETLELICTVLWSLPSTPSAHYLLCL